MARPGLRNREKLPHPWLAKRFLLEIGSVGTTKKFLSWVEGTWSLTFPALQNAHFHLQ